MKRGKKTRDNINKFMEQASVETIRKYRHDFVKMKRDILVKNKLSRTENELKKGSKSYYLSKLIKHDKPINPCGENIMLLDVYYHNKKTNITQIHKQYYVQVQDAEDPNKKPNIYVDYSKNDAGNILYFTNVKNVLSKMDELGTIDEFQLRSNFNHYNEAPIENAKRLLDSIDPTSNTQLERKNVEWMKGRFLKDESGDCYVVKELIINRNDRNLVKNVTVRKTSEEFRTISPEVTYNANTIVVMKLVIDFHENIVPTMKVQDNYEENFHNTGNQSKYKQEDFIEFKGNYFKNEKGEEMEKKYMAIVLSVYYKYHAPTKEYLQFYDLLIEDAKLLWQLETENVDLNSNKVNARNKKKAFLKKIKHNRNKISKILTEYDLNEGYINGVETENGQPFPIRYNLRSRRQQQEQQI